VRMMQPSR